MSNIAVKVKLFAIYQEVSHCSEINLNLALNTPVKAILDLMIQEYPELEKWRNLTRFGVNCQFVEPDYLLQNNDEIVLIPPVSGG
jgi:molybdopterin synthase sulfur carrier subunit